jgi:murein DD-endopeptidase MepM/ murein hydrolase activator NlpD
MTTESLPLAPLMPPSASRLSLETERVQTKLSRAHELSSKVRQDQLKSATQEFEALFLSYMLKVMRSTVESEKEETSSLGKDVYMEMFDNEIALNIARVRSLGIGEMMYRQLTAQSSKNREPDSNSSSKRIEADSPLLPIDSSAHGKPESSVQEGSGNLDGSFVAPIEGELTSAYGLRRHPLTQKARFHQGLDIAAPAGTPFRAAQSGTVIFSGVLGGYGNTIILEHAEGYRTLYAHAAKLLVSQGESVGAKQAIGIVGNTGRSTGTHLHFELQKGGEKADPLEFLTSLKSMI